LSFQWYRGSSGDTGAPSLNATSSTFNTPLLTASASYWVRVSNSAGTVDSATATITDFDPPWITLEPADQTIAPGTTASLTVEASGGEPLTFQWYLGTSGDLTQPIPDATESSLITDPLTTGTLSTASFWVRVSNPVGTADSATATITVLDPPSITVEPADQTVATGTTASLTVEASGGEPLAYQWYLGTSGDFTQPIPDATEASLITDPLTTGSPSTASFWVRITNPVGTADSRTVTITVLDPPLIATEPQDQLVAAGQTATLTVEATGAEPMTYQWYQGTAGDDTQPIEGASGLEYTTASLTESATFWLRAANAVGTADTRTATITVEAIPSKLKVLSHDASVFVIEITGPAETRWTLERWIDLGQWEPIGEPATLDVDGHALAELPVTDVNGLFRAVLSP
jgi:hypothetical protein